MVSNLLLWIINARLHELLFTSDNMEDSIQSDEKNVKSVTFGGLNVLFFGDMLQLK